MTSPARRTRTNDDDDLRARQPVRRQHLQPVPDPIDPDWQNRSACAANNWGTYQTTEHNPEIFYPKRLEGGQCAPAKSLCGRCPVRRECLTIGLKEPSGVWGGLSEKERRVAQKMAKRGTTILQILAYFDNVQPKRRRRTVVTFHASEVEAAALTSVVIEQFVEVTGTVPTGAGEPSDLAERAARQAAVREATRVLLEPSAEVRRERERRRNGL